LTEKPAISPPDGGSGADARHAARSGAVQTLTILLQAVTSATQVVFARLFGPAIYGAYQAGLAVLELATRAAPAGADKAMLRYVAGARASGDPEGVRRALGTGLRLGVGVSLAVGVALALGANGIARALELPSLAPALRILAFAPPFTGVLVILIQASLAARVTRINLLVRGLVEPSLLLAAGVAAWALGAGLRGLGEAQVLSAATVAIIGARAMRRVFRPEEVRDLWHVPRVPGFDRFALTVSAAEILNVAYQRADILIVTGYLGPKGAAVYAAAEFLTRVIANIRYAFDAIVAGVMAESLELNDRARLRYNLHLATRWVVSVAGVLAGAVIVLRRELLGGLYGAAYVAGSAAVVVLAISHFLNAALGLVGWVLVASGRSRPTLLNNFLGAAFNVGASLLLIPRYGFVGAAAAALGTTVVVQGGATIQVALFERVSPFSRALWKPLFAGTAAFAAEAITHALRIPSGPRVALVLVVGVVTYLGVLFAVGLPAEERRWVQTLRHRLRSRALAAGRER
jgi:O-antigen/teichoic acid export membrane protein